MSSLSNFKMVYKKYDYAEEGDWFKGPMGGYFPWTYPRKSSEKHHLFSKVDCTCETDPIGRCPVCPTIIA